MKREEFERHLQTLIPSLKSMINTVRKTRHFGYYDASDLLQEVLIRLYLKVPKHYTKEKGSLKTYCLSSAKNCIRNIARKVYKHQTEVSVDWMNLTKIPNVEEVQDQTHDTKFLTALNIASSTKPTVNPVLFKMNLDALSTFNKDYKVLNTLYKNDGDSIATCRELGICRTTLTKVFKRIRLNKHAISLSTNASRENIKNEVSFLAKRSVYRGMKENIQTR